MRILVTGSEGFVGRHLVTELLKQGHDVCCFDLALGDDLRVYEQVRATIEQAEPERIHHLAAQAYVPEGTTDPRRALAVNTFGTFNVLEAVRQLGSRARVHLAGTSEEYGYATHPDGATITEDTPPRPTTPYGASKLAATALGMVYHHAYGLPVVATRAYNHTGPGHASAYAVPAFARRVAEVEAGLRDRVVHGNLAAVRNVLDVRDVIRAYDLLAADAPSGVYNVCGAAEATVSMQQVLDTLVSMATVEVKTEVDDELYRPAAAGFPQPSHAKLTDATGWAPAIPLEQTLADVLDDWRRRL